MLLFHEIYHFLVYAVPFSLSYFLIKNKNEWLKSYTSGILAAIFIDIDHWFDYILYKKSIFLNLKEFFEGNYFTVSQRIYIPLHSWELIMILLIIFLVMKKRSNPLLFIIIGMSVHIIFDTLCYGFDWQVYFISYRYLNNFVSYIFHN